MSAICATIEMANVANFRSLECSNDLLVFFINKSYCNPSKQPRSPSALSNWRHGLVVVSILWFRCWTSPQQQPVEPESQVIRLHRSNNGMRLNIVAAKVCDAEIQLCGVNTN